MKFTLDVETRKFQAWTREYAQQVAGDEMPKALRKIAVEFLRTVIPKTPVDTGRARGGWLPYLEKEGVRAPSGRPQGSGAPDPAEERRGMQDGDFEESFGRLSSFVSIINGVSYLIALEYGSSDQAPAGMLRISMREMRAGGKATKEYVVALHRAAAQANRTTRLAGRFAGI